MKKKFIRTAIIATLCASFAVACSSEYESSEVTKNNDGLLITIDGKDLVTGVIRSKKNGYLQEAEYENGVRSGDTKEYFPGSEDNVRVHEKYTNGQLVYSKTVDKDGLTTRLINKDENGKLKGKNVAVKQRRGADQPEIATWEYDDEDNFVMSSETLDGKEKTAAATVVNGEMISAFTKEIINGQWVFERELEVKDGVKTEKKYRDGELEEVTVEGPKKAREITEYSTGRNGLANFITKYEKYDEEGNPVGNHYTKNRAGLHTYEATYENGQPVEVKHYTRDGNLTDHKIYKNGKLIESLETKRDYYRNKKQVHAKYDDNGYETYRKVTYKGETIELINKVDGKLHGQQKMKTQGFFFDDKADVTAYYTNGVLDGDYVAVYRGGSKAQGKFKNGLIVGEFYMVDDRANTMLTGKNVDGKNIFTRIGDYRDEIGEIKDFKKTGLWKTVKKGKYDNGLITKTTEYKNGKRDGRETEYVHQRSGTRKNPQFKSFAWKVYNYKRGEKHGDVIVYWKKTDKINATATYVNGEKHGEEKHFNKDGDVYKKIVWENGKKIRSIKYR